MNLEQMKYLVEVAKESSITKAADKLHLSPSAISQSISQLEKEFGVTIFSRSRHGTIPTPDGKFIVSKAYEILKKMQELHEELASKQQAKKHVLNVGCAPALMYIVYDAFLLFHEEFPETNVMIREIDQDHILEELKNGHIDVGLSPFTEYELSNLQHEKGIGYDLLYTGYVCVCAGKKSSLYYKEFITPDELTNEKIVIYNSKGGRMFKDKYAKNGQILFSSNNIEVLRSAILDGHAFSFVFNFTFKHNADVKNGNLAIIPFKNPELIYQDFWTLYPLTKGLSPEAKEFKEKVKFLLDQ
ncbi:LysR family transcriptional regulator [Fictibacillus sp. b24]|uniref:LysR family transcriptional regulator n=1 Tax=Fictibacillus sp. b24 TaxID=3055863 RepID=UPI0025A1A7AE|nr:LysR family transcriptional regulator [Fictibacillus sp. b24]MDM5315154.1 LysR family transcriptional regulator [Fictibacillus sp. b24]